MLRPLGRLHQGNCKIDGTEHRRTICSAWYLADGFELLRWSSTQVAPTTSVRLHRYSLCEGHVCRSDERITCFYAPTHSWNGLLLRDFARVIPCSILLACSSLNVWHHTDFSTSLLTLSETEVQLQTIAHSKILLQLKSTIRKPHVSNMGWTVSAHSAQGQSLSLMRG